MAHLWTTIEGKWQTQPLGFGTTVSLPLDEPVPAQPAGVRLVSAKPGSTRGSWWLLAPPGRVLVNGQPVWLGLRALRDRDEVLVPGSGSVFFSTESLARVEEFPGAPKPVFCPRCRDKIEAGPAVKCPACGVWHHQLTDRPCWTYSETCALCPQPSALNAGYQWTPERL